MICGNCSKGQLRPSVATEQFKFGQSVLPIPGFEYSVCDQCGFEVVSAEQDRRNGRRIADAKRLHIGLLSSTQIKNLRAQHGLSQSVAAKVFGGGPNVFSKYESGEVLQSASKDLLMRLVLEHPHLVDDLKRIAGIAPRRIVASTTRTSTEITLAFDGPVQRGGKGYKITELTRIPRKRVPASPGPTERYVEIA